MRPARPLIGAACSLAALATVSSAAAARPGTAASCVTVPATIPATEFLRDGKTSHYRPGALLFVTLVEPAKYTSQAYPPGFPWQAPVSSDPRVLARVPVCRSTGVSSLPLAVYAFRALKVGAATVVAPLKPTWRVHPTGLHHFFATVTIRPRLTRPARYAAQIRTEGSEAQAGSIHAGRALDVTLTSPDTSTGTRYTVCWSPRPVSGPACRTHPIGFPADHGAPSAAGITTLRFSVNGTTVLVRKLHVLAASS
jgi:hypothetical protein